MSTGRVTPSGRKSDPIWKYFEKLPTKRGVGHRAKCKQCTKELQGLVARMKQHHNLCSLGSPDSETTTDDLDVSIVQSVQVNKGKICQALNFFFI